MMISKKEYKMFFYFTRGVFVFVLLVFLSILAYLFSKGVLYFNIDLISSLLLPSIEGTLSLVFLSVLFATPIGIMAAIYIHSFAKGVVKKLLDFSFELLASIPSIIIGLFGFSLLLVLHRFFEFFRGSLILSSLSLSFLILPYIVKSTQLGFLETPKSYINIAYSLGSSKKDIIFKILLPFAKKHILKGVFLCISRSAEDTAVIMLTGVVASYGNVEGIFSPFEALPFYIYYTTANYTDENQLNTIFVAIVILMMISTTFMFLIKRSVRLT